MMCIESHLITSRGRLEHAVHIVSRRSTSHTQHLPVLNVQSCTLPLLFHTLLWPEIHTHPLSSVRPSHILSTLSLSLTNTICIITIIFLLLFLYDCSLWSSGANSWRKKQKSIRSFCPTYTYSSTRTGNWSWRWRCRHGSVPCEGQETRSTSTTEK